MRFLQNVHPRRAFSLVELLTVMSVIAVMTSFSVSVFKSASPSNLVNASNVLSGLMNQARLHAIANNTQSAIYICEDWPGLSDNAMRAASVWSVDLTDTANPGAWKQISKWEKLPVGVVIENETPTGYGFSGKYYAFDAAKLSNRQTVKIGTDSVTVITIGFNSLGAATFNNVSTPIHEVKLRISPGFVTEGVITHTSPGEDGESANWIDVLTDGLSGRVRTMQR